MSKRLPKYVPSLTRISVVDTPTTADKDQQINQVNDEFRKLAMFGNKLADDIEQVKKGLDPANKPTPDDTTGGDNTGGGGGGDITTGDTNININIRGNWALTLLHKAERLFRAKWTQAINFIDGTNVPFSRRPFQIPIWWEFENETIATDLKSDPNSALPTQTKVKATTMLDISGIMSATKGIRSIVKRVDIPGFAQIHNQPLKIEYFELVNDVDQPDEYMYYGTTNELDMTQSGTPIRRGWYDIRAVIEEFSWSITGDEHNTVRFNADGQLVETDVIKVYPGTPSTVDVNAQLFVLNGNRIGLFDPSNTYGTYLLSHPAPTAAVEYFLPPADGTNGQVLSTDGFGNLAWITAGGGGSTNTVKIYKLNFDKAVPTAITHPVTLPINSEILRVTVRVDTTLTGPAGQIKINGLTPMLLADEGIHYLSTAGKYDTDYTGDATIAIPAMVGNIEYSQMGVGTGTGRIFVEVGVPN